MKSKGFTLIELLAVIVILAIIALIATPIILNIIEDAKIESNQRSVEMYADAIKNAIAKSQLNRNESIVGTFTTEDGKTLTQGTTTLTVEYEGEAVFCSTIEIYENGNIYLAGCGIGSEGEYTYGEKQIEKGKLSSVCTPAKEQYFATSPLEAGYKYECKVDPNKDPYTFYVLNSTSTTVNLIMDSNINISGEAVKSDDIEDKGFVAWVTKDDYISVGGSEDFWNLFDESIGKYGEGSNDKGPITAMNYLAEATSNWSNLNKMVVNTFDSYGMDYTYVGTNNMKEYNVYARLPYYSEMNRSSYLYDHMLLICFDSDGNAYIDSTCGDISYEGINEEGINHVNSVTSYWLLDSEVGLGNRAWSVIYKGSIEASVISSGVRPVITLQI